MSQRPSGHNLPGDPPRGEAAPPRRSRRRAVLVALASVAWIGTIAQVLRSEVVGRQDSAEIRALVESAQLSRTHASARYEIRVGGRPAGWFRSSVSGGQDEEQLAYVLQGELTTPQRIDFQGFVLADWDRRPRRFVGEASVAGIRHRIEGGLEDDPATGGTLFVVRHVAPVGGDGAARRDATWVLPEAPTLAPGPLPVPELGAGPHAREGSLVDPLTGQPRDWRLMSGEEEDLVVAGRLRRVRRHAIEHAGVTASAWTERTGFPVRLEIAPILSIELVEETR